MKYIAILALALSLGACSSQKPVVEKPFEVSLESTRIPVGTLEAQFDKTVALMGLRQVEVTVSYFPAEDAVCLQYRIDFMTYYLFWSRKGRETYLNALERYKEDFTQRNLKNSGSRSTRRAYGKADCYLIWQAGALLTRSRASNVTEIGYDIKNIDNNKASFFTLTQRESTYIPETSKTEWRNTKDIFIYLTRAKADELAAFFDQSLLSTLVPDRLKKGNETAPDLY
jgi:hypothetical protein